MIFYGGRAVQKKGSQNFVAVLPYAVMCPAFAQLTTAISLNFLSADSNALIWGGLSTLIGFALGFLLTKYALKGLKRLQLPSRSIIFVKFTFFLLVFFIVVATTDVIKGEIKSLQKQSSFQVKQTQTRFNSDKYEQSFLIPKEDDAEPTPIEKCRPKPVRVVTDSEIETALSVSTVLAEKVKKYGEKYGLPAELVTEHMDDFEAYDMARIKGTLSKSPQGFAARNLGLVCDGKRKRP